MTRTDGRTPNQLRPLAFHRGFHSNAEGSVLVCAGSTKVLCTVSITDSVPAWRKGSGEGWLTAEYAMLPGSVVGRKRREFQQRDGRSIEIQRLIGRALRSALDMRGFPNSTLNIDCDVLQADGGTRCASICGAMVAIHDALKVLDTRGKLQSWPLRRWVGAVSVGHVSGKVLLDLDYSEDFAADVDMNVIATADSQLVEVQGTAEGEPFARAVHDKLLDMALSGTDQIIAQMQALVAQPVNA
ncbi:MAG: ribonuclease PH [Planctomycetota bacterium]|nr:ribonuclease PH [Planctomycetota bacterium]MDA1114280.1 ribonuclease PH [Planctomycetota bacterium]